MARPKKQGLDYFPFDVDTFEDEKIEAISGEFGIKGEIITIRLLCAIYRQGYFTMWSDQLKYKIARRTNLSPELVNDVILRLVRWNFFNKDLFDSMKVLTSKGIQTRWKEATRKRVRKGENLEFFLLNDVSGAETTPKTEFRTEETPQSKVKESKVIIRDKLMAYFGFNEQSNFDKLRDTSQFVNILTSTNQIDRFELEFQSYQEFKKISEQTIHSFSKFLGTVGEKYLDGAWNAENWTKKLEDERNRKSPNKKNRSSLQANSPDGSNSGKAEKTKKVYSATSF